MLFVDAEPNKLAVLRRLMHSARDCWEMVFAGSAAEALLMIEDEPVAAIISALRMPGMDGAQLLAAVKRKSPGTARIILAGQAGLDNMMTSRRSVQQVIVEPCNAKMLSSSIDQAIKVQQMATDSTLRQSIAGFVSRPVVPENFHELVFPMASTEDYLAALVHILSSGIRTGTELLGLDDSGASPRPPRIVKAVPVAPLIGLTNVWRPVLTGSLQRVGCPAAQIVDLNRLQGSALRRAEIARLILGGEGWFTHECGISILSCLLRDVGRLVLAQMMPSETAVLNRTIAQTGSERDFDPARRAGEELDAYGCTIAQASACLLELWGFAPTIVHTVAGQPLTQTREGVTRFEYLLDFAEQRAIDQDRHVSREPGEYLTAERLATWNSAADEALKNWHSSSRATVISSSSI